MGLQGAKALLAVYQRFRTVTGLGIALRQGVGSAKFGNSCCDPEFPNYYSVLTGLTHSPLAVNTTTSSAAVNVTMQITDNLSGVASAGFRKPLRKSGSRGLCKLNLWHRSEWDLGRHWDNPSL
jgi:hypothetical protein